MQIQRCLLICIIKALACHNDTAIYGIFRIQKVYVTGCYHKFIKLLPQFYNLPVYILQIFFRFYRFLITAHIVLLICKHERIVSQWLNFQIIIELYDSCHFFLRTSTQQRTIQLSRLTGRTKQNSFPIFHKFAFWNFRPAVIIFDMGIRYQTIQIYSTNIVLRQHNGMVTWQLSDTLLRIAFHLFQIFHSFYASFPQHFHKFCKYLCCTGSIVYRTMMIFQRNVQCFCDCI